MQIKLPQLAHLKVSARILICRHRNNVATTKADQVATNKATDTTATVTTDKRPVLKEDQASSTYNLSDGETRISSTSETANTATEVNSQAPESVETTVVSGGQFKRAMLRQLVLP